MRLRLAPCPEPRAIGLGNGVEIMCRPCSSVDIAAANAKAARVVASVLAALDAAEDWGVALLDLEIDPDRAAGLGRTAMAVELAAMLGQSWNVTAPLDREALRQVMICGGASEIFLDGALRHTPFTLEPDEGNVSGAAPDGDGGAAPFDAQDAEPKDGSADRSDPTTSTTTSGAPNL